MYRVDLNSDLGESFGRYMLGCDAQVLQYVSSCNIACGFHAGDASVMRKTVALAHEAGVSLGAHPGFPDLQGFGRREMKVTPDDAYAYVMYQVGALQAFAHAQGTKLHHVKPHGALYNQAAKDTALAASIAQAVYDCDSNLVLVGLANGELITQGTKLGLKCASEFFIDRNYADDGTLADRKLPNALITDESFAIERLINVIMHHELTTIGGKTIEIQPDTVCIHGDGAKALAFAERTTQALSEAGIEVAPV